MSFRITERSLYPIIGKVLEKTAKARGVTLSYAIEAATKLSKETRIPDLFVTLDGYRVLILVKIGGPRKILEDLREYYPVAREVGADLVLTRFSPEEIKRISPEELERVGPRLPVAECLVLTPWLSTDFTNIPLQDLSEKVIESFLEYRRTRVPLVDYGVIASVARTTIEELAGLLRKYMGVKEYESIAQAIVGKFDFYKAMLADFVEKEEIMKTYIADIIAYITVIQLLFAHIASVKRLGSSVLPRIENPLEPPRDLLASLRDKLKSARLIELYPRIVGTLDRILEVLDKIDAEDPRVRRSLTAYIYSIQVLRPEHVRVELYGRIYQEGIPPETRKNLGAFFTKPEAARLLAGLSIRRWDDKVLDPACGSGTLLAEAYRAKLEKAISSGLSQDLDKLHKLFIEEHIYGIDIMQFAKELTTVNLTLQRPEVTANPMVFVGDGITKMLSTTPFGDDPPSPTLEEFVEIARKESEKLSLPREGFDVVIMNPPFTRRERIPEDEREKLDRLLGHVVRGKVGYWAYFFVAADNVIKPGGRLAVVAPEEFFAGASAESVRRFLFLGEVYDKNTEKYVKKLNRFYRLKYVIKSAVEPAFSEQALYRDYLVVLEKVAEGQENLTENTPSVVLVILKKRLDELRGHEEKVLEQIKAFELSANSSISTEYFDAVKIMNVESLISKYIRNLKPIVGLTTTKAQKILLELMESLQGYPTLAGIAQGIKAYNPGQYTTRGIEDYARKLFAYRYEAKGKRLFRIIGEDTVTIELEVEKSGQRFKCNKSSCIFSLRSPAGVKRFDITGIEEVAIVDYNAIPNNIRTIMLANSSKLSRAIQDIKQAYEDIASNILLARRLQLTSPNIYWLAFYSDRRVLNTAVLVNILDNLSREQRKLLTLYLNSSITLLQLLALFVETRGAWIDLHGEQVWAHVRVPDLSNIPKNVEQEALDFFNEIGRIDVKQPLYERIKTKDMVQRRLDSIALKMLHLEEWLGKLNEVYDALAEELNNLHRILKESKTKKKVQKSAKKNTRGEGQGSLSKFFKRK